MKCAVLAWAVLVCLAAPLGAAERYALVITGASGDAKFGQRYDDWRERLTTVLADRLAFGRDHLVVLAEKAGPGVQVANRDNVRSALAGLASRMHKQDLLLVVLIGHGSYDGTTAKFNLVGPDLDAGEWASLLRPIPGKLIFVDTTSSSFPFLQAVSSKGRVVITATDSHAARYDTVFAEQFIKALETSTSGITVSDRLSIWDVFAATTAGVRRHYEQEGLLPVEHALLDDAGDGFGKDAEQPGLDTSIAQATYLTGDAAEQALDPALRELLARRDDLLDAIDKLKAQKAKLEASQYEVRLEQLLVDLAKVSRALRARQGTWH
ncbi:MAG: hypothetical protein ACM3NQ_14490 [Bacteroidales bacterium]